MLADMLASGSLECECVPFFKAVNLQSQRGLSRMPWISTVRPFLLEKAIMLFGERGYNGVTTRDLARAADIAEGSIYNLFKSKENLYIAALDDVTSRTQEELGQMLLALYSEQKNQGAGHFI